MAHAAKEPMNCVARPHDGRLETWSGHQFSTMTTADLHSPTLALDN